MMEQWRAVPGYEGWYEVSDAGRFRSIDRLLERGHLRRGRIIAPQFHIGRNGQVQRAYVRLSKNSRITNIGLGRLVLLAFVGPCPAGMECCHCDGDPTNNALSNLRWDTHSENMLDQVRHGTHYEARRTYCEDGSHLLVPQPGDPSRRECRECKAIKERRRQARIRRDAKHAAALQNLQTQE